MKVVDIGSLWSAKDYINTVLMDAIERDKFHKLSVPSLSKIRLGGYFVDPRHKGWKDSRMILQDQALFYKLKNSKIVFLFTTLFLCK